MNRYDPGTPKALFGCTAVALTAVTLGALVLAPAKFDSGFASATTLATAAPTEVSISPARIEVIAVRGPNVAWAMPANDKPNCRPEG